MQLNSIRRDAVFLLLAIMLVAAYVAVAGGNFPLDDSWIHQTYGRNLAELGEWSFVPGEPSAASTSPLYTVLLSIGYRLEVPFRWWTHGMGALALALTAMLAARLAQMPVQDVGQKKRAAWFAGLGVLGTWHLIWAAASSMETIIFSLLTLALLWLAWRELEPQRDNRLPKLVLRGAVFGGLTALATLARPEGVLLGAIAALLMLVVRPQGSLRSVIVYGVGAALAFAAIMSPYLALNLQLTGGLLPDTAQAKFEQFAVLLAQPYPLRLLPLYAAILVGGQILLLPGAFAYLWRIQQRGSTLQALYWSLPLLWLLALPMLYAARLPAAYQHGRYLMPALPALIVVGTVGTLWLVSAKRNQMVRRVVSRTLVVSIFVAYGVFVLLGATTYRNDVSVIDSEMVVSAFWIRENLPDDALLAIHDIGAVGYFSGRDDLLDIAGLVSPEVIPIVNDADALWDLMESEGAQYLMAFPSQIPGRNVDDPRLCQLFSTDAAITRTFGRGNTGIYRLAYNGDCSA